jgi:DNA-binding NarL/FixJ family response regulator
MSNIKLSPEQIQELTQKEVENALLAQNKLYRRKLHQLYYHLETASEILREINKIHRDKHPRPPKQIQRRPYNVDELKELMAQGKKPMEIAEILGRSVGSVRLKIREIKV